MSRGLSNYTANGSSTTDEYGTFKGLSDLLVGDVINGFAVVPNGTANMTVLVQPGSARIKTGTAPADYSYWVFHDTSAGESVTIAAANTSPRIDYIVAYVDKNVAASTSPANVNNTNNIFKFASVAGTPAGSPAVPTISQITATIGAANPYIILAQVAVAANTTQITAPNITDKRALVSTVRGASSVMGLISGSSVLNTTGLKTISGLPFMPRRVSFTVMPASASSGSNFATGAMTSTFQYYAAIGTSGSIGNRISGTNGCLAWVTGAATTTAPSLFATYVSMNADGFTFNLTTANGVFDVVYEAFA